MAFPEDPLGLRVEIQAGGAWTDITADVQTSDPITHARGIRNSGTSADPASVPLKIDNKDGKYSPRNPMSPLYGAIGRNTPVRLWLPGGVHFLDVDGNPANTASTPDAVPLNITGDLDLRVEAEANWYGPGARILIGKWDAAAGQRSYMLRLENGQLVLHMANGADGYTGRWNLPALPRRAALRATHDVDNGAGGSTLAAYWATSMAGPWTLIEAGTGPSFAPGASTAPLVVAPQDITQAEPRRPFAGKAYAFEVRNGIGGTLVASPNFEARPLGASGFTDSAGRVWTLNGTAAITDRQDLFVGEISAWPQKWVPSGQTVWTSVEAAGILRRLGQGQKALDSTLRRRIPSGNPVAYWPMEEDRDATRAYSPMKGVAPAALTGVEFAAVDTLPSSRALPKLSAAGALSAIVPTMASGQWQVECVYNADDKAPPNSGTNADFLVVSSPDGTVRRWTITMRADHVRLEGFNASGTAIVGHSVGIVGDIYHGWYRMRLYARDLGGGQMEYVIGYANVDGSTLQLGATITGTPGRVSAVTGNWGPLTEGWSIGHLSVMPTAANTIYDGSDSAYAGETAWQRMRRLCTEEGVPLARIAGPLTTERVGAQRSETLVALLQAAAEVDGGMLLEDRTRTGLLYRDRSSLYTQDPALTLTYGVPGLAPPLEPVDDDTATRNDIIVSRDGGSSARAVLETGPLSVQQPPDGIGLYDESVSLALNDDVQPEAHAFWRLHLGTFDGARYPSVRVLLHKAPALIPQVLALREGDVIRIKGLPGWVAYGDVDLIVTGSDSTLLPRTWEMTFTCVPAWPWMTAQADHPVYGKANTDGSELAGPITSTDTTPAVRTTAGLPWTTDPQETPFEVQFGGEVARVDAVGQLLNGNPWFDSSVSGWTGAAGSIAWSQAIVHPRGSGSIRLTPGGSAESHSADADLSPVGSVIPGALYKLCGWFYSPTGSPDIRPSVHWYTDAGVFISTSGIAQPAVPAGKWTYLEATATAPATAGRAKMRARQGGTPPISQVFYAWGLRLLGSTDRALSDTFSRTNSGGWGSADTGQPWAWTGGAAADYAVNGTVGQHVMNTQNTLRYTLVPAPSADVDVRTDWALDKTAVADSNYTFLMARYTDTTHLYFARVQVVGGTQAMSLTIRKRNGAETQVGASFAVGTYTPGVYYTLRFQVDGSTLRAKCWQRGTTEPAEWQIVTTDTDLTAIGSVGVRSLVGSASTQTLPVTASFDNFQISDAQRFTVTRSVNQVTKSHAAGTPVSLAHPAIASL